jgi:hypothetical protein
LNALVYNKPSKSKNISKIEDILDILNLNNIQFRNQTEFIIHQDDNSINSNLITEIEGNFNY